MTNGYYDTDDPITALATPWGESALAVVRTSGNKSIELFASVFSRPGRLLKAESGSIIHGYVVNQTGDPRTIHATKQNQTKLNQTKLNQTKQSHNKQDTAIQDRVDEVTAAVYRAPSGYTGQDSVEIFCHGSLPGIQRLLDTLHAAGFRDARPGEFTLRAFMNGKMDLTQAEAVHEIVSAKSKQAQSLALGRLSGNLFHAIDSYKRELVQILSIIEVQLDYAEDEIEEPIEIPERQLQKYPAGLEQLAATYSAGRIYAEGARVALTGRTNSGKSSLFNLFLKEDRSIVSDIHGTTRDYIESWITVKGVPIKLYDTAGFRTSSDQIEEEGIRRSTRIAESADLIIYIIDGTEGMNETVKADLTEFDAEIPVITIWNKVDISNKEPLPGSIAVSAVTGEGFSTLETKIISSLPGLDISQDSEIMIDSMRQKELLDRAVTYIQQAIESTRAGLPLDIIAPDIGGALDALGEITGEVTSADILDSIFSGFCVGK